MIDSSASSLIVNSPFGGSVYQLGGHESTYPDDDMRVMVMQIITSGTLDGVLNFQIFDADQEEKFISISFDGTGTFYPYGDSEICGCTDLEACNYNSEIIYDDGSCLYIDECGGIWW